LAHSGNSCGGSQGAEDTEDEDAWEKIRKALECLFKLVLLGELDLDLAGEIQEDIESRGLAPERDYFNEFLERLKRAERGEVPDYFSDFLRWWERRGDGEAREALELFNCSSDSEMPADHFTEFRKKYLAEEVKRKGLSGNQTGLGALNPAEGIAGFPPGLPALFNSLIDYVRDYVKEVASRNYKEVTERLEQVNKKITEISSMLERFPKPEKARYVVAAFSNLFSEEELKVLTENERYKLLRAYEVLDLGYADQGFPNLVAVIESMLTRLLEIKTGQEAEYLFQAAEKLEKYYEDNRNKEKRADLMIRHLRFFKTLNIYWRAGGKHIDGLADQELSERQMIGLVDPVKDLIRELSEAEKRSEESGKPS